MTSAEQVATYAVAAKALHKLCERYGFIPLKDADQLINRVLWEAALQPSEPFLIDELAEKVMLSNRVRDALPPWGAD